MRNEQFSGKNFVKFVINADKKERKKERKLLSVEWRRYEVSTTLLRRICKQRFSQ